MVANPLPRRTLWWCLLAGALLLGVSTSFRATVAIFLVWLGAMLASFAALLLLLGKRQPPASSGRL